MSVRVTDNTSTLASEFRQRASVGLRLIADAIVSTAEPKTPKRQGNLRRDVVKQVLGLHGEIRWGKNYAGYQELRQYRHYTTPGTGPHFAENAVRQEADRADGHFRKAGLI